MYDKRVVGTVILLPVFL